MVFRLGRVRAYPGSRVARAADARRRCRHTFEWRREACFILRKPDPPVQVAVTKEPSGRIKTSTVQILDYNLHRFDINDRKGKCCNYLCPHTLTTRRSRNTNAHGAPHVH